VIDFARKTDFRAKPADSVKKSRTNAATSVTGSTTTKPKGGVHKPDTVLVANLIEQNGKLLDVVIKGQNDLRVLLVARQNSELKAKEEETKRLLAAKDCQLEIMTRTMESDFMLSLATYSRSIMLNAHPQPQKMSPLLTNRSGGGIHHPITPLNPFSTHSILPPQASIFPTTASEQAPAHHHHT